MASSLPPLVQATAGSAGAVVSSALSYPLDTALKRVQTARRPVRKQPTERAAAASRKGRPAKSAGGAYDSLISALRSIYAREGLAGFYGGLASDLLSTFFSQFIFFIAYAALRNRLQARKTRAQTATPRKGAVLLSPWEELGVGCLAGAIAKGIVSPLSMITVRAQTSHEPKKEAVGGRAGDQEPVDPAALKKKKRPDDSDSDESDDGYGTAPSTVSIAKEIYREQGLAGFWSGFQSTLILTLNPAITMHTFNLLKRVLIPARHREHPTPSQTFLSGALASAFASALTYPLILAKTRLQFKSPTGRALYKSQFDVFRKTIARQGIAGLYQGVESKIALGFFSEGVKLLFKDRIELLIVLVYRTLARQKQRASS
ncbi:hypothetical protein JCM8202_004021 [Rhodotorula sphaerocarpa]